jgi:hypothetical protein
MRIFGFTNKERLLSAATGFAKWLSNSTLAKIISYIPDKIRDYRIQSELKKSILSSERIQVSCDGVENLPNTLFVRHVLRGGYEKVQKMGTELFLKFSDLQPIIMHNLKIAKEAAKEYTYRSKGDVNSIETKWDEFKENLFACC